MIVARMERHTAVDTETRTCPMISPDLLLPDLLNEHAEARAHGFEEARPLVELERALNGPAPEPAPWRQPYRARIPTRHATAGEGMVRARTPWYAWRLITSITAVSMGVGLAR
jgi:hypothetical protein